MSLAWIGADWGTSRLRAWAFDAGGEPTAAPREGPGMGGLAGQGAAAFEAALVATLGDWLAEGDKATPVLVCGMAGARQGWQEAPYRDLPLALEELAGALLPVPTGDRRIAVALVPGLAQRDPAAPDVLRGEETQALGFLAGAGGGDWTLCLPGTHSKWLRVTGGVAHSLRSYMTGELFALLSGQSMLRHTLGAAGAHDAAAFAAAVDEALAAPEQVVAQLFALRARDLLFGEAGAAPRARLSGLLIGQELASVRPAGERVAVIGDDRLAGLYVEALAVAGCPAAPASGEAAVLSGLRALHRAAGER